MSLYIEVELTDEQVDEVDGYIAFRAGKLTREQALRELALRGITYTRTAFV